MSTRIPASNLANSAFSLWGAALRRGEAAHYCGFSAGHFDKLVGEGLLPLGREASGVTVWLRRELDIALEELPVRGQPAAANSCDGVFGC